MSTPRWLREPLVQFVGLGGLLFAAHYHLSPRIEGARALTVDDAWARAQAGELARSLGRAPTADELALGLGDAVDQERLYREGLRLGLERDDPIVRRRVIQKMGFVHEERAAIAAIDDEAIAAEIAAEPARYALPERWSLTQVFFPGGADPGAEAAARAAQGVLEGGADPAGLGAPLPHGQVLRRRSAAALRGLLGDPLVDAIAGAPPGAWVVAGSPLGWHVVRVDAREPASAPEVAAVRSRAAAVIRERRRQEAAAAALAELREATPLRIEVTDPTLRQALEGR